jgi:hypothetical protein
MKKVFLALTMLVAVSAVSCKQSSSANDQITDSVTVVDSTQADSTQVDSVAVDTTQAK